MNKISIALSLLALLNVGCSDKPTDETKKTQEVKVADVSAVDKAPQGIYGTSSAVQDAKAPSAADVQVNAPHIGKVLETMNAGGYTYAKVEEKGSIYWVAAPQTALKVGDSVSYIEQMMMKDFTSKSLGKKFDFLMFASAMVPPGASAHQPTDVAQAHMKTKKASNVETKSENINVAKLSGGYTVEEIYSQKDKLKDKKVKLRAKVVKISREIMGKDWIHLQDGTGINSTSDIIVTTKNATVDVGDVVVTEAVLNLDVDLGYGYFFPVILQDGKLTK